MVESKQHQLWAIALSFGILSFVTTSLRLYTRARIVRSTGIDDVLIAIAELWAILFLAFMLFTTVHGMGRHIGTLSSEDLVAFIKGQWGLSLTYTPLVMFGKLSVLSFYLRMGGPHGDGLESWFKFSTYGLIVLTILVGVVSEMIMIFQCKPFNYQWNKIFPGTEGSCWNMVPFYFVNAGFNIFLDICITALPMPVILRLTGLSKRTKASLCGLFSIGGFVCAITVVRVAQLPALNNSVDITWDITDALIWYYIECTLIITGACGPALKPFFKMYTPGIMGNSPNSDGSDQIKHAAKHSFSGNDHISTQHSPHQSPTPTTTRASRNIYGQTGSEEFIIQEGVGMGILNTTDVVLAAEGQDGTQNHSPTDNRSGISGIMV